MQRDSWLLGSEAETCQVGISTSPVMGKRGPTSQTLTTRLQMSTTACWVLRAPCTFRRLIAGYRHMRLSGRISRRDPALPLEVLPWLWQLVRQQKHALRKGLATLTRDATPEMPHELTCDSQFTPYLKQSFSPCHVVEQSIQAD